MRAVFVCGIYTRFRWGFSLGIDELLRTSNRGYMSSGINKSSGGGGGGGGGGEVIQIKNQLRLFDFNKRSGSKYGYSLKCPSDFGPLRPFSTSTVS